jgi:hypothetical protein
MADPDPLKRLERELADQEKQLAAHRERLQEQLDTLKNPPPPPHQETVWRAPTGASDARRVELDAMRRVERVHSAQRRRDRARFFLLAVALLVLLFWLIRLLK